MAKDIDLSEFLSSHPPKKKVVAIAPTLPPQHISCPECKGTGKRVHKETHTPELTEAAENLLLDFGKILPVQQKVETVVKCEKCSGVGHFFVSNDVRAKQVTMFWTRSKCRCGACYEGPAHQNTCLIMNHVFRPIIVEGRQFGWRYVETTYTPSQILPIHATLPMNIEYFDYTIEACRKCIREHMVICLPHEKEPSEGVSRARI